jgi:pimeloyl-ACP methyl ester carboxylesterase
MENILLLHGWGVGSKTWLGVKNILEKQGYRVFVPDLPGFGDNPEPKNPWTIDDYAEWVADFCAKNNLTQFFLIGHSFGGGISVKFVAKYPEKVKKLVLIAAKLHRHKTFEYYGWLFLSKIGNWIFRIPGLSFLRPLAQKVLYKLIGVRDYYKLELEKVDTMKKTFQQVVGVNLLLYLPQIQKPALIVWGTKDEMTPLSDAYLISKGIKDSKLEIIKDGRHALNLQCPEKLAEIINKFLKSN